MKVVSEPEQEPGPVSPGAVLSAFRSPRRNLWGIGTAIRIAVPPPWPLNLDIVRRTLQEAHVEDRVSVPGSGPVAFGALPFDTDSAAEFVIPSIIHGATDDGQRWVTHTHTAEGATTPLPKPDVRPVGIDARCIEVRAVVDPQTWCGDVANAKQLISQSELSKIVLSREIRVTADRPFDAATLYNQLSHRYRDSLTFAVDDFIGASPELLVSRVGEVVRAQPMAGTTARSGDPSIDHQRAGELLASEKNRREHQITIDMVHDALLPWCSYLDAEPTPSVVPAGPVQHLATLVEGRLSTPAASVLDLVAALHPTPAVGGWPVAPALDAIRTLEPTSRGRYAGPVGWVDANGDGAFAVGVRSAQLMGESASLFVGVGIVEDSNPRSELEETRIKSRALLDILVSV